MTLNSFPSQVYQRVALFGPPLRLVCTRVQNASESQADRSQLDAQRAIALILNFVSSLAHRIEPRRKCETRLGERGGLTKYERSTIQLITEYSTGLANLNALKRHTLQI